MSNVVTRGEEEDAEVEPSSVSTVSLLSYSRNRSEHQQKYYSSTLIGPDPWRYYALIGGADAKVYAITTQQKALNAFGEEGFYLPGAASYL